MVVLYVIISALGIPISSGQTVTWPQLVISHHHLWTGLYVILGSDSTRLTKLQKCNTLVCLLSNTSYHEHISPVLHSLHKYLISCGNMLRSHFLYSKHSTACAQGSYNSGMNGEQICSSERFKFFIIQRNSSVGEKELPWESLRLWPVLPIAKDHPKPHLSYTRSTVQPDQSQLPTPYPLTPTPDRSSLKMDQTPPIQLTGWKGWAPQT